MIYIQKAHFLKLMNGRRKTNFAPVEVWRTSIKVTIEMERSGWVHEIFGEKLHSSTKRYLPG